VDLTIWEQWLLNSSNEAFWQQETARRNQIRKWLVKILLGFICAAVLAWVLVTQPLLTDLPIRRDIPPVNSSRMKEHVKMIVEDMFPRDAGHPRNLDRLADLIRQSFIKARGEVSEQSFVAKGKTYRNVIASFGLKTNERIIVGAHYDTAEELPGSDDNASGIAGLLELAYLLGNTQPGIRVDLVGYTLEEPPYFHTEFMGSAVHAQLLQRQNAVVRLMISLEMIGYFSDASGSQSMPLSFLKPFYPTKGNFIAIVSKLDHGSIVRRVKRAMRSASALPVYSLNAPRFIPGIELSDHLNYWEAGYDAIMVTDTAFLRNLRYHTAEDTPETLDYKRMAMVVQGVYAAILEIAKQ
jgi:hypothetical protein